MTTTKGKFYCNKCDITFPGEFESQQRPRRSCPSCHKSCDIDKRIKKNNHAGGVQKAINEAEVMTQLSPSHDQKPANSDTSNFIDDPNELLMSCAKRALNKKDPEVRWATILVNILKETKQLEAVNSERDEIQSKLKQYSTTDLISLRKKLTGNLQIDG